MHGDAIISRDGPRARSLAFLVARGDGPCWVIEPGPLAAGGDGHAVVVAVWAAGVLPPGVGADHFVEETAWAGLADGVAVDAGPGVRREQSQG
jgi:hypothetical protein